MREMIETFRLMTSNNPMNASRSETQQNDQYRRHRNGHQYNYNGMTRLAKVDFPRFNGDNVKEWMFKVEEFFGIDNTPVELKVRLAIHFDQTAAAWHQSLAQSEQDAYVIEDWEQYKILLKERFEDVLDD
uniref:Retrotransposon gag domain-containing protein n=1 Tax=Brassica oleracea var. oleracea TaxID=109376 RepID=A0A0D3CPV6_BRAOL